MHCVCEEPWSTDKEISKLSKQFNADNPLGNYVLKPGSLRNCKKRQYQILLCAIQQPLFAFLLNFSARDPDEDMYHMSYRVVIYISAGTNILKAHDLL